MEGLHHREMIRICTSANGHRLLLRCVARPSARSLHAGSADERDERKRARVCRREGRGDKRERILRRNTEQQARCR